MQHYLGVAEKEGVTDLEIDAIQAVAMSMSACRVRTQFADVRDQAKARTSKP